MRLIFLAVLIFPRFAFTQNLLMNGSFEEENICTEYIKNCAPEGWISTSLRSDYYFDDVKHSWDGQHFVGLLIRTEFSNRPQNYLRSRLLCGLRKGAQYKLRFYIRSVHPVFDSIGVYFSGNDILYQKEGMKNTIPQLWVHDGLQKKQTVNWQTVTLTYTASGTENYITIGDFKKQGHSLVGQPDLGPGYYFFIDDISLVPLNPHERLCADAALVKEQEYNMNERHTLLDKKIYLYTKRPPVVEPATPTVVQRIDTLVIPDVLFAVNSYALNNRAYHVLDSFILKTKSMPIDSVVIEGHTDSTGKVATNMTLSQNRSKAVYDYIMPYFHTPIISRYWASEKPVADNRTAWGRQKNRRVEIYLYVRD